MPAYKKPITRNCQTCQSIATWEVFNTRNSSMGYFCRRHAIRMVAEMNSQKVDF